MPKTKHELNARKPSFLNLERCKGCENHAGILRSFVMTGRLRHETHIINGLIFFAPLCFRGDHIPDVHFDAFQPTYLLDLQGVVTNSLHALAYLKLNSLADVVRK